MRKESSYDQNPNVYGNPGLTEIIAVITYHKPCHYRGKGFTIASDK